MARRGALLLLSSAGLVHGQGAAQIGGRPPKEVVMELCGISDVFMHV